MSEREYMKHFLKKFILNENFFAFLAVILITFTMPYAIAGLSAIKIIVLSLITFVVIFTVFYFVERCEIKREEYETKHKNRI